MRLAAAIGLGSENMEVDALGILSRYSCGLMGLGDEGMALYRVHEKDGFRHSNRSRWNLFTSCCCFVSRW